MAKAKKKGAKKTTKKGTPKKKRDANSPTCKLSQKLIDEMVAIVEKGNFRTVACQRLGISPNTYRGWQQAGQKQLREVESGIRKEPLLQGKLIIALDRAEGYVHGRMVENVLENGTVRDQQWFLERRFNKLYSRNPNAHRDDETGEDHKLDARQELAEKIQRILEGKDE